MKTTIGLVAFLFVVSITRLCAQDVTTVEAKSSSISENLDLEAVASIFGEAEDLEDFEKKLNDPDAQISNLDLNEDGEVDYLRVVESSQGETFLVTIQAVIAEDLFQDVAVIDVEKDDAGETQVQVVGDVYMYGPNYIITPVYVRPPLVVHWFWGPRYSPWHSPYYWGYYPPYYRPWRPYPTPRYHTNVHVHVNVNNSYHRTAVRKSSTTVELHNKSRRNDYGARNPNKSHASRPATQPAARPASKPATQPAARPASKPATQPAARPASKPATQPAARPASKPATQPAARPASRPAAKPAAKPASRPKRK